MNDKSQVLLRQKAVIRVCTAGSVRCRQADTRPNRQYAPSENLISEQWVYPGKNDQGAPAPCTMCLSRRRGGGYTSVPQHPTNHAGWSWSSNVMSNISFERLPHFKCSSKDRQLSCHLINWLISQRITKTSWAHWEKRPLILHKCFQLAKCGSYLLSI